MSEQLVSYELIEGIARIQMDDGKVNALSSRMLKALEEALDRAENEAKALILTGREGRFSAGFDLKAMTASRESAIQLLREGCGLFMRLYNFPLPVVIACTGHAIAGGALTLLCGDYRIGVAGDFRIGLNEVAIGMPLPILALELARDRLAKSHLDQATLGAKLFSSEEAVTAGYLDQAVTPEAFEGTAMAIAQHLGGYSRAAFAQTKARLREKTIGYILETLDADLNSFKAPIVSA